MRIGKKWANSGDFWHHWTVTYPPKTSKKWVFNSLIFDPVQPHSGGVLRFCPIIICTVCRIWRVRICGGLCIYVYVYYTYIHPYEIGSLGWSLRDRIFSCPWAQVSKVSHGSFILSEIFIHWEYCNSHFTINDILAPFLGYQKYCLRQLIFSIITDALRGIFLRVSQNWILLTPIFVFRFWSAHWCTHIVV